MEILNGGRPRFWPRLKTDQIQQWGVRGWGRGGRAEIDAAGLPYRIYGRRGVRGGRGRAGRSENKFVLVLNAACMHVVLHYFTLSPFCCCSLFQYKKVPQERYTKFLKQSDIGNFMYPSAVVYCCCVFLCVDVCCCVLLCVRGVRRSPCSCVV